MLVVHEGFLTVRDTSQSFFLCLSCGDPIKESHIKRAGICLIIVKAYNQVILLRESASGRSLNDLLVHIYFFPFSRCLLMRCMLEKLKLFFLRIYN
jgi:hypothetical protein